MDKGVFKSKRVLVTGATGLIGKCLTIELLKNGAEVFALVRNIEKATAIFKENSKLHFIVSDIVDLPLENMKIEYIIHGASQTGSKDFVYRPVETINTAVLGTLRILEFARLNPIKGFIYLSSMEVYGTPYSDNKINELYETNINTMKVRSCYPEGKRMCESICSSYASEYEIPTKVVRLTQTFGPGVQYNDGRVFAEFARCVIENKDIVLKTKGETKRNYLYTEDAVSAILMVLIKGKVSEAYNIANEKTYCSIHEMAELVAQKCAKGKIKVVIDEEQEIEKLGYAPTLHMNLDCSKIKKLGWNPKVDLEEMFNSMIEELRTQIK